MATQQKTKLTQAERGAVVDLYACGGTTTAAIDYLLDVHPEWRTLPRQKVQDAIRTCNPHHGSFAEKWKVRYESTQKLYEAENARLIKAALGHAAEVGLAWHLKLLPAIQSLKISELLVEGPNDLLTITKVVQENMTAAKTLALNEAIADPRPGGGTAPDADGGEVLFEQMEEAFKNKPKEEVS